MRTALLSVFALTALAACPKEVTPPQGASSGEADLISSDRARGVLSDARFKRDVTDIEDGLTTALALRPVRFVYDRSEVPFVLVPDGPQLGLVAQEVREVLPSVVREELDGFYRIEYEQLIPLLISAVQEQEALIEAERARIDAAEARIQSLETTLQRIAQSAQPTEAAAEEE